MLRFLLLLFLFLPLGALAQVKKKPNILYIMSDDHTSQAWGIYGGILSDYLKNDHIKWLANNGVVLNNAFCTNSICVPSRAAIVTGQYSHVNKVYDLETSLPKESVTYPQLLQASGYQTALIGKWHLTTEPQGFDHYSILPGQGRYWNPVFLNKQTWSEDGTKGQVHEGYSTDVIADQSIEWLEKRDKTKPFYLSTHFKATHEPFDYPARYDDYLENVEIPYPASLQASSAESGDRVHDGWPLDILGKRYEQGTGKLYPGTSFSLEGLEGEEARKKTYQKFIKDYIRCGAAIDDNIGRLIDYLQKTGELENTIIIYTSDQGYFLGEHGFFDKRFIYEPSLRMPFVISYPNELPKGKRVDDIVLNIDFASLFLDYAGIPQPATLQGKSFRKNLQGKTPKDWRKDMYYRYWANEPNRPAHFGIRTDRYKLAFFYGQSRTKQERDKMKYEPAWEFYDLKKDPQELQNAIDQPEYKEVIRTLKKRLYEVKQESGNITEENPTIQELVTRYW